MFLHDIDLTPALRPSLLQDETLLFVQDNIGLYQGKYKLPQYQNGHVYLTSHRVCYVDNDDPRKHAVAVDLKDVDSYDVYAGFLKSSPKVTLTPIASKLTSLTGRNQSPRDSSLTPRQQSPSRTVHTSSAPVPRATATWICQICSFSNPMPQNFDPITASSRTYLPPCKACGIKPNIMSVVKAALVANRQQHAQAVGSPVSTSATSMLSAPDSFPGKLRCPRCTFDNHRSLRSCEVCGAPLGAGPAADPRLDIANDTRTPSPGPFLSHLPDDAVVTSIKFSFHTGGDKAFCERLKAALVQRKWLLQNAPPVPKPADAADSSNATGSGASGPNGKLVGIAGLEMRGDAQRRNNEQMIGGAFEDLETLMTFAKDIVALAESFSVQAREDSASGSVGGSVNGGPDSETDALVRSAMLGLGTTTTRDMLVSSADALYTSELARNMAEFLMDDSKGNLLKREGGIMSLVDVWALFNRVRNGVELVSPADFEKAAREWDRLKLPIRLRQFKSGLLVVQGRDRTDEKTVEGILAWLRDLRNAPREDLEVADKAVARFGRSVTIQEAASKFGWSMGVASEEMDMAEERGALCREVGLDGVRFWENWFVKALPDPEGES